MKNFKNWDRNTTLIVGDSMLSGIVERRIAQRDKKVNVKIFPGAIIDDMYDLGNSENSDKSSINQLNGTYSEETLKSDALNEIRKKNPNRIIIAHLNINSIRNKFEMLKEVVGNKIDVLLISETKLDDTFPLNQFILEGFTPPYRIN